MNMSSDKKLGLLKTIINPTHNRTGHGVQYDQLIQHPCQLPPLFNLVLGTRV